MVANSTRNALSTTVKMYVVREIAKTREIRCEKCGSLEDLEFHHLKYAPKDNVSTNDIQILCDICHRNLSKRNEKRRSKLKTIYEQGKRYCCVGQYKFEY